MERKERERKSSVWQGDMKQQLDEFVEVPGDWFRVGDTKLKAKFLVQICSECGCYLGTHFGLTGECSNSKYFSWSEVYIAVYPQLANDLGCGKCPGFKQEDFSMLVAKARKGNYILDYA